MKLFLASDHRGYLFKKHILQNFKYSKIEIIDCGPFDDNIVDYPDYAHKLCVKIKNPNDFGILVCNTGIGMSMAANRHSNIRAALCNNIETAILSRKHNDANVLVIGASAVSEKEALKMVEAFITTNFESGRHADRIHKINIS